MQREKCHHGFRRFALAVAFGSVLLSCSLHGSERYAFSYPAKTDHGESVYYSDELFSKPSTEYRSDLATTSLSFAMASFASGKEENNKNLTRYNNIKSLLESTGFVDFEVNSDYKKRSELDTIGLAFGHKAIGDKTLIYVGIRGANYEMEWGSNFTIADPDEPYDPASANPYHYGFHKAATQLIRELSDYISAKGISGGIKLWTSGFSRAGATANITGGLLDQAIELGEKPLGSQVNLLKRDLYVYCFEPPMGAPVDANEDGKLLARGDFYNNIFNHLSFNDPVPLVAMREVGYTRFGVDRYFPDPISSLNGNDFLRKVEGIYMGIESIADRGAEFLLKNFEIYSSKGLRLQADESAKTWTQGLYVKELVAELTEFGLGAEDEVTMNEAKSAYYQLIQPAVRALFKVLYKTDNFKGSLIDVGTAMVNGIIGVPEDANTIIRDVLDKDQREFFYDDVMFVVKKGLKKIGVDIGGEDLRGTLGLMVDIMANFINHSITVLKYTTLITTLLHFSNISCLGFGHYPELCLASMRALDKNYVSDPFVNKNFEGKYFTVTVSHCLSNITVRSGGKELLKVSEEGVVNASVPARFISRNTQIVLPYGEKYDISIPSGTEASVTLFDYTYRDNDIDYPISIGSDGSFSL